jgi:hypothetical protein
MTVTDFKNRSLCSIYARCFSADPEILLSFLMVFVWKLSYSPTDKALVQAVKVIPKQDNHYLGRDSKPVPLEYKADISYLYTI